MQRGLIVPSLAVPEINNLVEWASDGAGYGSYPVCPACQTGALQMEVDGPVVIVRCARSDRPCSSAAIHRALNALGIRSIGPLLPKDEMLQVVPAGDFMVIVGPPLPPIVTSLIPDRSLLLLTGKSKSGKSLLGIDILDCIATGAPVFGSLPVNKPGPALYLGMEDSPHEISTRLMRRGIAPMDKRKLFITSQRCVLSDPVGFCQFYQIVRAFEPVIVLIDTAREALDIRDWSSAAEVGDKLRPIRNFARDFCTIILVAHNRKIGGEGGDEISGTNALTSSVDGWLSCHHKETLPNGDLQLQIKKEGRGGMHGELVVRMDAATYRFSQTEAPPAAPALRLTDRTRAALEVITSAESGITILEIAQSLEISESAATYCVRTLLSRRLVHDTGRRGGQNSLAHLFSATENAISYL